MTLEETRKKILTDLTDEQISELQEIFIEKEREVRGIAITKDNCDNLFEGWLESLTVMDLEKYLEL